MPLSPSETIGLVICGLIFLAWGTHTFYKNHPTEEKQT